MTRPERRVSFFFGRARRHTTMEQKIRTAISMKEPPETSRGLITVAVPRMNRLLKIFEPTTLPIAMSFSPFEAATMEVMSSGRLVPKAMIVSPIRRSLIPAKCAIQVALLIVIWPPAIIPARPIIRNKTLFIVEDFSVLSASFSSSLVSVGFSESVL